MKHHEAGGETLPKPSVTAAWASRAGGEVFHLEASLAFTGFTTGIGMPAKLLKRS